MRRRQSIPEESAEPNRAGWSSREAFLLGLICLTLGLLAGYILRGSGPGASAIPAISAASAPGANEAGAGAPPPTAESLQPLVAPLLAALRADPKNFETLVQIANLYYDHRVYPQAIEYYTRALAVRANDANVRTDLGTAYWYSGLPDKAVAEYEKSLKINPSHPNTLFNLGVVRSEGLKDYAGAIAAWQTLLQTNPDYPDKPKVIDLIAKAQAQKGNAK